ncbi:MAG: glycosyltransferase family 4 protein [Anaerolineae bacterium]|nr:glycosyltransferase family 4 protein [Anaerolineae bacterium]
MSAITGRVGIQQRVLANYRVPFFDLLSQAYPAGLQVYAGQPRRGETIDVAGLPDATRYIVGHNVHLLAGKFYLYRQPGITDWVRQFQPHVLVVEINARNRSLGSVIAAMRASGGAVVGWGLGAPERGGWFARLAHSAQHALLERLDAVIAYSQRGAQEYARLGFPAERIVVAPNAVVRSPGGDRRVRRAAVAGRKQVVLYVGRLQARKRVDLLLRAAADLPREIRPEVWIVGDGPERLPLERLASQLALDARFFGSRFGDDLDELYERASLFVLPGTGGLALQQAMAHGLPVIAAEGDGTQQDLVTPDTGWLVEPGNLASLNSALKDALTHPERLDSFGRAAWQLVKDEVNLDIMVDRFVEAINLALELQYARSGRR